MMSLKRAVDRQANIELSDTNITQPVATQIDIIKKSAADLVVRGASDLVEAMQACTDVL